MGYLIENKAVPSTIVSLLKMMLPKSIDYVSLRKCPNIVTEGKTCDTDPKSIDTFFDNTDFALTKSAILPSTYLPILASPLQLQVMGHHAFPFWPILSHPTRFEIRSFKSIKRGIRLDLTCRLNDCYAVKDGVKAQLFTSAECEGVVFAELLVTYFARHDWNKSRIVPEIRHPKKVEKRVSTQVLKDSHYWNLPVELGWSFAKITGDYNPVYMSAVAAKSLGYDTAVLSEVLALCGAVASFGEDIDAGEAHSITAEFRRPVPIPSRPSYKVYETDGCLQFELASSDSGHILAEICYRPITS